MISIFTRFNPFANIHPNKLASPLNTIYRSIILMSETQEAINQSSKAESVVLTSSTEANDIEDLHKISCTLKLKSYIDPKTGYTVFTEYFHLQRGNCCGNACRHCPYQHSNVKTK